MQLCNARTRKVPVFFKHIHKAGGVMFCNKIAKLNVQVLFRYGVHFRDFLNVKCYCLSHFEGERKGGKRMTLFGRLSTIV